MVNLSNFYFVGTNSETNAEKAVILYKNDKKVETV